MFEHGISAKWLRRAQWAIYAFFGTFAFGGLWYVFHSAFERDIMGALIGAGVVWGSLGLGVGMHCITQMASVVDGNRRALAEFAKRLDAMEQLVEELGPPMNLSNTGLGDPTTLVAAHTDTDAFPRLVTRPAHDASGLNEESSDAYQKGSAALERERPSASLPMHEEDAGTESSAFVTPETLRVAFRAALYQKNYRRAIEIGEEITERWPESEMADHFDRLRPAIERRAEDPTPHACGSA